MLRLDWDEATRTLLAPWLLATAKTSGLDVEALAPIVSATMKRIAGPMWVDTALGDAETAAIARAMLVDAIRLAWNCARPSEHTSVAVRHASGPIAGELIARPRINVNSCTAGDLVQALEIDDATAGEIVGERRRGGLFPNATTLRSRVAKLDPKTIEARANVLEFSTACPRGVAGSDEEVVQRIMSGLDGTSEQRLLSVLERTQVFAAGIDWSARYGQAIAPASVLPQPTRASYVGILRGKQYYPWLASALKDSKSSIDVKMFHIALPAEDHPTRKLLDALIEAHHKHGAVRVLVDRDRDSDPYKSTIINTPAVELLNKAGVPARFDTADRLLHSKVVVIDNKLVVIGSHNWSAGSYFAYDDVTVAVNSPELAAELRASFDRIWQRS